MASSVSTPLGVLGGQWAIAGLACLHLAFLPWLFAEENPALEEKAAEAQLLLRFTSADASVRDAAAEQLRSDPVRHWDVIKQLFRHEDPEVRTRAQAVAEARADVLWERLDQLTTSNDESLAASARKAREMAFRAQIDKWYAESREKLTELQTAFEARRVELEEFKKASYEVQENLEATRTKAENDGKEANAEERDSLDRQIERLQEEMEDSIRKVARRKRDFDEAEKRYRMERNWYQTRCDQFTQLLRQWDFREMDVPTYPIAWDPRFLRVAERRELKISFEFVDMPLSQGLEWMSEMTGLHFKLADSVAASDASYPSINLRVTDMTASLALGWVLRLAELDYSYDPEDPARTWIGRRGEGLGLEGKRSVQIGLRPMPATEGVAERSGTKQEGQAAPAADRAYPLWNGEDTMAQYAAEVGLPPTRKLDLGDGIIMEFGLVPAGRFMMGTPKPEPVDKVHFVTQCWLGQVACSVAAGVLLTMLVFLVARAIRDKHRLQFSLARLLVLALVTGVALLGFLHWKYSERRFEEAMQAYVETSLLYGKAEDREKPGRMVTIARPFYMGTCEVTLEQYGQVMGVGHDRSVEDGDLTAGWVSWNDARAFCERLTKRTGETVRLPSEAEWEYACRAGTRTAYHSGDEEASLKRIAWYEKNSGGGPHPVRQLESNAFGLYDMHGNLSEWCGDEWHEDYEGAPSDGRAWISRRTGFPVWRMARGGYYDDGAEAQRSACRQDKQAPGFRCLSIGFRCVLVPSETKSNDQTHLE